MTNVQEEQLKKFGNDKMYVDGTHDTIAYDIQS